MATQSLRPYGGDWQVSRRRAGDDPFFQLHREINRLFDDVFRGFGLPALAMAGGGPEQGQPMRPSLEMSETDGEIKVCAELPGIDEKDVEVTLDEDMLTIRGEKKAEQESQGKGRNYHMTERSYGTFMRSIRLPAAPNPDQVQASFKNGVLTVTMPKPQEAKQRSRRIEVRAEGGAGGGARQSRQRPAQPSEATSAGAGE